MKINNNLLQDLMIEVEQQVDKLMLTTYNQQQEIDQLKNKNKLLKDSHAEILKQIAGYINELEEIKKHSNTK